MARVAICFTSNGQRILRQLNNELDRRGSEKFSLYVKMENHDNMGDFLYYSDSIDSWTGQAFKRRDEILIVGAVGIAVRAIAAHVNSKLYDSPVVVMDDNGLYAIPILSGHIGGANKLATLISECVGALPIITTSTDINDAIAIDNFATSNNLKIINRDGIKKVNASILENKRVTLSIKDYPPQSFVDVLISDDEDYKYEYGIKLSPKKYVVGIGCKKGKSFEDIIKAVDFELNNLGVSREDIYCIATIDIKEDESGIKQLRDYLRVPLISYEAELLKKAQGDFTSSTFVADTVGVDNVCERACVLAAGEDSKLVIKKSIHDGVTVAIARRKDGAKG